ncbi:MAG: DUF2127 domain-containing protein [Xanthomonadales bacterium]|nr:DUF2127 domain-containing protein [Xanthomonadales bacterium]
MPTTPAAVNLPLPRPLHHLTIVEADFLRVPVERDLVERPLHQLAVGGGRVGRRRTRFLATLALEWEGPAMNSPVKSGFITALGWTLVAFSGMGTMVSILQNIMLHTVFGGAGFDRASTSMPPDMPWLFQWMMSNFAVFFALMLGVAVITLIASIGLLLRKNWARVAIIVLMIGSIASQLIGLHAQFSMMGHMRQPFAAAPGAPDMGAFFVAMAVFSAIFGLGFCVLFGWIAKRLMSPEIAAEFGR